MLPDDILLETFYFYHNEGEIKNISDYKYAIESWVTLVHVCQRWRTVVFGSPHYLGLRLASVPCLSKTPARDPLDVWPPLPLSILGQGPQLSVSNIIAALKRGDRVDDIELFDWDIFSLKTVLSAMLKPFPELTYLYLGKFKYEKIIPVLPDSFLGGTAPRLRRLYLSGIPFPALPKLLLSSAHLVDLSLRNIPQSGYFSPEAIITALSLLTSLKSLWLEFLSPRPFLDQESRRLSPPTRSVLPVITFFLFKGASEYLEVLVARIDAPRLNRLHITFFNDIVFDTPHLVEFISLTPALKALKKADFVFNHHAVNVEFSLPTTGHGELTLQVLCRELDWQVSSLVQILNLSPSPVSKLEDLYINEGSFWIRLGNRQDNIENAEWLELLRPFAAVKNLYLSLKLAPLIAFALQELAGGSMTELLPNLQNIFLEGLQPSGPVLEGIQQLVSARQVNDHPIIISLWDNPSRNKTS